MRFRRLLNAASPSQLVVGSFVTLILFGTALLRLPFAVDSGSKHPGLLNSLFTATSASTVTGLGTVDITVFSLYGELVLLFLIQVGGFGIMTIGSVLALVASRRVGLRQRIRAQTEIGAVDHGELRRLVRAIGMITLFVESSLALILFLRFWHLGTESPGRALYSGIFHSVSSFNNAGISLYPDSMVRFAADPTVIIPISAAFVVGGLGFPVLVELRRGHSPRRWSLHTRITLLATAILLAVGPLVVLTFEWTNPLTLGPMPVHDKLTAAWFQGVSPRTAGFNSIDIGSMHGATLLIITALMFIGAGPASTSGGIKVTTFAVLGYVMWAEVKGTRDVNMFRRRLSDVVIRQAITVALLSVTIVFGTGLALEAISPFSFTETVFEAASAFGTVGLSTGITAALPGVGQFLLILVMLAGRVGPITFVTAIALSERTRAYRYPEERPIIG